MANRKKTIIVLTVLFTGLTLSGCSNPATNFSEALRSGNREKAKLILEKNPNLGNMRDKRHCPAFITAAGYGDFDLVRLMLSKGANVNINWGNHSALNSAVTNRDKKMVILLLAKGADVKMGGSPLKIEEDAEDVEIADLLRRQIKVVQEMHDAAKEGDIAKLRDILPEKAILVNSKDPSGKSLLYTAAENGRKDIVEYIISNGAKINEMNNWRSSNSETPLFGAAKSGNRDVVELLIEHGAEINRIGPSCYAPLDYAVDHGHIEVVELLISKGAKIKSDNERGDTLLHIAARSGRKDMAEYLITKGLKVNAKRYGGRTPLHEAIGDGGWTPSEVGQRKKEMKEMVEFLIAKGADVNVTFDNENRYSALHVAVMKGYLEIIDVLVANGADVNAKTRYGKTPLQIALNKGHNDIADLLRKHGAVE